MNKVEVYRAEYGANLLKNLEKQIDEKGMNVTLFKWSHQFYLMYSQKGSTVSHLFALPANSKDLNKSSQFKTDAYTLLNNLSFSHIRKIMMLEDEFERFFYETQCIKCNWSVRELRKQIKTNLYVRAGISKNPKKLLEVTKDKANTFMPTIKDPFTFNFLDWTQKSPYLKQI